MPRNSNKTRRIRKGSKRNKRLKKGGTCGCGQKLLHGGEPIYPNAIPLNNNDSPIPVSARNLGGKRSKKVKGGSIMSMFNSVSNGVTGASSNGVFSFGTIPGAQMSKSVLYGVPLNNPSTWVQPVKNVYSNDNPPLV